jgi:hypothetical protein
MARITQQQGNELALDIQRRLNAVPELHKQAELEELAARTYMTFETVMRKLAAQDETNEVTYRKLLERLSPFEEPPGWPKDLVYMLGALHIIERCGDALSARLHRQTLIISLNNHQAARQKAATLEKMAVYHFLARVHSLESAFCWMQQDKAEGVRAEALAVSNYQKAYAVHTKLAAKDRNDPQQRGLHFHAGTLILVGRTAMKWNQVPEEEPDRNKGIKGILKLIQNEKLLFRVARLLQLRSLSWLLLRNALMFACIVKSEYYSLLFHAALIKRYPLFKDPDFEPAPNVPSLIQDGDFEFVLTLLSTIEEKK